MVDSSMFETIGDESVIAPEFIGVNEASPFHLFDSQLEKSLTLDVGDHLYLDLATSFQDPEHRDFPCRTPATPPLSSPPK